MKANLACSNPIEISYYSSGNDAIYYFYGTEDDIVSPTLVTKSTVTHTV